MLSASSCTGSMKLPFKASSQKLLKIVEIDKSLEMEPELKLLAAEFALTLSSFFGFGMGAKNNDFGAGES